MKVPDVLGERLSIAQKTLEENGFDRVRIVSYSSRRDTGHPDDERIVRQRTIVDHGQEGCTVELVVCNFQTYATLY